MLFVFLLFLFFFFFQSSTAVRHLISKKSSTNTANNKSLWVNISKANSTSNVLNNIKGKGKKQKKREKKNGEPRKSAVSLTPKRTCKSVGVTSDRASFVYQGSSARENFSSGEKASSRSRRRKKKEKKRKKNNTVGRIVRGKNYRSSRT